MDYIDLENLIEQSEQYLSSCTEKARRQFGVGGYARFEYDLFRNEIWWSDCSGPKVRGKLTIVGSFSNKSETWLWAWDNPHFREVELGPIDKVRDFGDRERITKLTEPKWVCDEAAAWQMTSISARLLEAQGAYRATSGANALFLLFDHLEFIPDEEITPYLPLKRPNQTGESDTSVSPE